MLKSSESLIASVSNIYEEGCLANCVLDYYLTETNIVLEDDLKYNIYGIKIAKVKEFELLESKTVVDISTYKEVVNGILNKLIKNGVTPISLDDIIEDSIAV